MQPKIGPRHRKGATLAPEGIHGDAMTVTDEQRPADALPAGPGHGIPPTEQDPAQQPGQYATFEESEALQPDVALTDPSYDQETAAPGRFGAAVLATPSGVTATKLLNEARSHLGFVEGRNNDNPFWVWSPSNPWLRYASYCASAATYCFWHVAGSAGLNAIFGGHYNCAEWVATFQRHSRFYARGQRGDLVFYDWTGARRDAEHVGIVESVDAAGNVTAVEFNTLSGSGGGQSDGGGCYRRTRGPWCIVGYGRPAYVPEGNVNPTPADPTGTKIVLTVDGVWGPTTTRRLQQWLGVAQDGQIGPGTRTALQRALGVTADGQWGPATHKALQRLVGVPQDGAWGPVTVKALQRYLNAAGVRRGVRVVADDTVVAGTGADLLITILNALFDRFLGGSAGRHSGR